MSASRRTVDHELRRWLLVNVDHPTNNNVVVPRQSLELDLCPAFLVAVLDEFGNLLCSSEDLQEFEK